jgi:hypothetical protein
MSLAEDTPMILSLGRIFYNLSGRSIGCPQSMSFTVLVLDEDPDLVLGTNLLQSFRKTFWVSSKLVSYRPHPC